jgi:putative phosphoribosyl transferase
VRALLRAPTVTDEVDETGVLDDPPPGTRSPGVDDEIAITSGALRLPGHLHVPSAARGLVLFAHGSGSSRHSPRDQFVARHLQQAGLATLLFDLLSPEEAMDRANVFDVELLAVRLLAASRWARLQPSCAGLRIGYFGASTGAAAALWAAAEDPTVRAVVSRGGRPDLAAPRLGTVRAPTLLVVGGDDTVVLGLNEEAARLLTCEHQLVVVRGATHLFEEPGTLEAAADLARDWFVRHLAPLPAHA